MKTLILIAALSQPIPPIPSQPCESIYLPDGSTMCATKTAQRRNFAPRIEILGDIIRTQYETDARRLCHHMKGTHLVPVVGESRAWQCFRVVKP
jgi:hypothetical protein